MSKWILAAIISVVTLLQGSPGFAQAYQRNQQDAYMQSLRDICADAPSRDLFQSCMESQYAQNLAAQEARKRQAASDLHRYYQEKVRRDDENNRQLLRGLNSSNRGKTRCSSTISGNTVDTNCETDTSTGTEIYDLFGK